MCHILTSKNQRQRENFAYGSEGKYRENKVRITIDFSLETMKKKKTRRRGGGEEILHMLIKLTP